MLWFLGIMPRSYKPSAGVQYYVIITEWSSSRRARSTVDPVVTLGSRARPLTYLKNLTRYTFHYWALVSSK